MQLQPSAISLAVSAGPWTPAASLRELPPAVQQQLGVGSLDDAIADRGEPFNAGCLVFDQTPRRRFLLGAVSADVVIVAVEFGGIALNTQRIEFRRNGQSWTRTGTHPLGAGPVTLPELGGKTSLAALATI